MSLSETLASFVDIPSPTGFEGRLCTNIASRLMRVRGDGAVRRIANSLVVGDSTGRPMVLLVGHLDTVPPQGQAPAKVDNDRLFGLGAADMKGGIAVMVHLLEHPLVRTGEYDVVGIFYEGEEGPASGNALEPILNRLDWLQDADFAIVLEPSDGEIQLGCNGVVNAEATFIGKSAHSARPWWGENAITKAVPWIDRIARIGPVPVEIEGLEYKEVLSITRAAGGIANNVIPGEFVLNLNYRFSPLRSVEEAISELEAMCAGADRLEVIDSAPAGPVDVAHPLVEEMRSVSGAALAAKQGWTDVARLGLYGIPAVNFGPGEAFYAHKVDESIALGDLDKVYETLLAVLSR